MKIFQKSQIPNLIYNQTLPKLKKTAHFGSLGQVTLISGGPFTLECPIIRFKFKLLIEFDRNFVKSVNLGSLFNFGITVVLRTARYFLPRTVRGEPQNLRKSGPKLPSNESLQKIKNLCSMKTMRGQLMQKMATWLTIDFVINVMQ